MDLIFDSPICEEKRFQFIAAELLSKEDRNSLLEFCKDRNKPVVKNIQYPIYTWDYFAWKRWKKNFNRGRSINERGLGYCNYCGRIVKFVKNSFSWQCCKCGAYNPRIYNDSVKR